MLIRETGRLLPLLLAAPLAAALPQARAAELVVIVSARSPVTSLRAEQAADICLAEVARYPEGGEAVALDQNFGSPLRNEFYSKVAAKTPALMKAYWAKMIDIGRGQPPREARGRAAVRRMVAGNPALTGDIDRAALDASLRAVLVLH